MHAYPGSRSWMLAGVCEAQTFSGVRSTKLQMPLWWFAVIHISHRSLGMLLREVSVAGVAWSTMNFDKIDSGS